jgi:hypothetical protein
MKNYLWVVVLAASGCGGVSAGDGRNFIKTLVAANSMSERPTQNRILMRGCSEISSCAGSCKKSLEVATESLTDEDQASALLAHCNSDYKAVRDKGEKVTAGDWFRNNYLPGYADKARAALEGDDDARLHLAAERKRLGL